MDFQSIALPTELWYLRCFASAKIQLFSILLQKKIFFFIISFLSLIISIFAKKVLMSHIITIDIGNTRAKYAIFKNDEIIETATFNPYNNDLKEVVKKYPTITRGILSSVGGKIEECLKQMEGIEVFILSGSAPLPFKMGYNDKEQIGSDRLVAVAAAMLEKPKQNSLVIDIGTCITYDIITSDDTHYGGPISPGIRLRFKSMNDYTDKLPLCSPSKEENKIICSSTEECLQSGVLMAISFEIEGFIKMYSNIYKDLNVFIIGGDNIFFENQLKNCIFADSKFTFKGLKFILDYQ